MNPQEPATTGKDTKTPWSGSERNRFYLALAIDLLCIAAVAAKDNYLLANFAYLTLPQVAVLVILWLFKHRISVLTGTTYGLALTVGMFGILAIYKPDAGAIYWSWYLISLPGAAIGGILGYILIPKRKRKSFSTVISLTALASILGAVLMLAVALSVLNQPPPPKNEIRAAPKRRRLVEIEFMHDRPLHDSGFYAINSNG